MYSVPGILSGTELARRPGPSGITLMSQDSTPSLPFYLSSAMGDPRIREAVGGALSSHRLAGKALPPSPEIQQ